MKDPHWELTSPVTEEILAKSGTHMNWTGNSWLSLLLSLYHEHRIVL